MKRTCSGEATDAFHPSLSFHREVLIVQEWNVIRREFLEMLQALAREGGLHTTSSSSSSSTAAGGGGAPFSWKEPKKLWRHSQEALGKWVLSQVARINDSPGLESFSQSASHPQLSSPAGPEAEKRAGAEGVHHHRHPPPPLPPRGADSESIFFFPSKKWKIRLDTASSDHHHSSTTTSSEDSTGAGQFSYTSYDAQLLRDLSIKSSAIDNDEHAKRLERAIQSFQLLHRCTMAEERVHNKMRTVTPFTALVPVIRVLEEGSADRSLSQNRMKDVVIEITAASADHSASSGASGCTHRKPPPRARYPVVSITKASLEKLRRSYAHFGQAEDQRRYGAGSMAVVSTSAKDKGMSCQPSHLTAEECFIRRAAVVALRYEGGLATGSLQLCADTALKQHLHSCGYHVVDLCASPINAYCGVPQRGTFRSEHHHASVGADPHHDTQQNNSTADISITSRKEVPNRFCSAFIDTDYYFGSLGSALRVNPFEIYDVCIKERVQLPHSSSQEEDDDGADTLVPPLLLTYDVPYDEDLCEQLFLKLESDLAVVQSQPNPSVVIDYILVLPLWWRIPLRIDKSVFFRSNVHLIPVDAAGHVVVPDTSETSRAFREAAAEAEAVVASRSAMLHDGVRIPYTWPQRLAIAAEPFLCWDALFLDESYQYFCTATNQWLRGVTATEVIALQTRQKEGRLTKALASFYGDNAVPRAT